MSKNYEEPQTATAKQHAVELVEQLKYELNTMTAEELLERGHIIEEYGRIIDELTTQHDEDEELTIVYSDGLNFFEILK